MLKNVKKLQEMVIALRNGFPLPQDIIDVCSYFQESGIYLTGSQWLGIATPYSDWDFFVDNTMKNKEILTKIGFHETGCSGYEDMSVVSVFERLQPSKIHIQVVKDAELKSKIQEKIKIPLIRAKGFGKSFERLIWQSAFLVAEGL